MVEERRKAPRKLLSESLKLDSFGGQVGELIEARTIDISKTGALCILNKYIPPFTKLKMMLTLPDSEDRGVEKIECESVIVRVEPAINPDEEKRYRVAIYFVDFSEDDRVKLDNFLMMNE